MQTVSSDDTGFSDSDSAIVAMLLFSTGVLGLVGINWKKGA